MPLSADEVRRLTGPIDDETLAAILRLAPEEGDVAAAVGAVVRAGGFAAAPAPLEGKAAAILDILAPEDDDEPPAPIG